MDGGGWGRFGWVDGWVGLGRWRFFWGGGEGRGKREVNELDGVSRSFPLLPSPGLCPGIRLRSSVFTYSRTINTDRRTDGRIYVYMNIYIHMYTCIHIPAHEARDALCTYMCIHTCIIYIYIYIEKIYICIRTYVYYIYSYVHLYTHTCAPVTRPSARECVTAQRGLWGRRCRCRCVWGKG
jgi:hypothetical protein